MTDLIPPSKQALRDALELSDEIIRNVELSECPLASIALKSSRLARLLNDFNMQKIMQYEAGGYPSSPSGVAAEVYQLAAIAGREYQEKDRKGDIKKLSTPVLLRRLNTNVALLILLWLLRVIPIYPSLLQIPTSLFIAPLAMH